MALIQRPEALGLTLCDQVVFELGTQKPYLLGVFTSIAVDSFPSPCPRFDAFAALTDGLGDGTIDLAVIRQASDEELTVQHAEVSFPEPLRVVNVRFRFRQLSFTQPGNYMFVLRADGQEIAHRRVHVHLAEEIS